MQRTTQWQKTLESASLAGSFCEPWVCGWHLLRDHSPGLEKNEFKPWLKEEWCIPPKSDAAFVCQMEDVLEIYKLPYDAKRPVIGMDKMPKQLLADKQEPLPCQVGTPAREDYEYKRNGVADLFVVF